MNKNILLTKLFSFKIFKTLCTYVKRLKTINTIDIFIHTNRGYCDISGLIDQS